MTKIIISFQLKLDVVVKLHLGENIFLHLMLLKKNSKYSVQIVMMLLNLLPNHKKNVHEITLKEVNIFLDNIRIQYETIYYTIGKRYSFIIALYLMRCVA